MENPQNSKPIKVIVEDSSIVVHARPTIIDSSIVKHLKVNVKNESIVRTVKVETSKNYNYGN